MQDYSWTSELAFSEKIAHLELISFDTTAESIELHSDSPLCNSLSKYCMILDGVSVDAFESFSDKNEIEDFQESDLTEQMKLLLPKPKIINSKKMLH